MSLVAITSPLAALNPKVWTEDGQLRARTNLFIQILCLFFWQRTVIVDRRERTILVRNRFLWLLERTHVYAFGDLSHIDYKFSSMSTGWDMFGRDTGSLEKFIVSVTTREGEPIELFAFRGDGTGMTGVTGVMLGDSLVDYEGDQAGKSLGFVEQLQRFTGLSLGKKYNWGAGRY